MMSFYFYLKQLLITDLDFFKKQSNRMEHNLLSKLKNDTRLHLMKQLICHLLSQDSKRFLSPVNTNNSYVTIFICPCR